MLLLLDLNLCLDFAIFDDQEVGLCVWDGVSIFFFVPDRQSVFPTTIIGDYATGVSSPILRNDGFDDIGEVDMKLVKPRHK
jgi:hypothetical protein